MDLRELFSLINLFLLLSKKNQQNQAWYCYEFENMVIFNCWTICSTLLLPKSNPEGKLWVQGATELTSQRFVNSEYLPRIHHGLMEAIMGCQLWLLSFLMKFQREHSKIGRFTETMVKAKKLTLYRLAHIVFQHILSTKKLQNYSIWE